MSIIDKLMGLATVGGTVAGVGVLNRFLSGVTTVVVLTIVSAFMCCILLAAGFAAAYFGLIAYGLDAYSAALTIAVVILLLMAIFISFTIAKLRQLRELPYHNLLRPELTAMSRVHSVVQSFLEGLLTPSEK